MQSDIKEQLVDLLVEECKVHALNGALEKLGIQADGLSIDNHSIVLDLIGFPKDNSTDERFTAYQLGELKEMPADFFSRDWLSNGYAEIIYPFDNGKQIPVSFSTYANRNSVEFNAIRKALSAHIEWLYSEYERINETPIL